MNPVAAYRRRRQKRVDHIVKVHRDTAQAMVALAAGRVPPTIGEDVDLVRRIAALTYFSPDSVDMTEGAAAMCRVLLDLRQRLPS